MKADQETEKRSKSDFLSYIEEKLADAQKVLETDPIEQASAVDSQLEDLLLDHFHLSLKAEQAVDKTVVFTEFLGRSLLRGFQRESKLRGTRTKVAKHMDALRMITRTLTEAAQNIDKLEAENGVSFRLVSEYEVMANKLATAIDLVRLRLKKDAKATIALNQLEVILCKTLVGHQPNDESFLKFFEEEEQPAPSPAEQTKAKRPRTPKTTKARRGGRTK